MESEEFTDELTTQDMGKVSTTAEEEDGVVEVSKIPRVIHQMWIDRRGGNLGPPTKYIPFTESIVKHNPGWTYKLWNGDQIEELFKKNEQFAPYYSLYKRMRYPVMKADIARLIVLYLEGGVYLDLDFVGYRPLDILFQKYPSEVAIVAESPEASFTWRIANCFLASVPKHPVWLGLLGEITRRMKGVHCQRGIDVCAKSGPVVLTEYLQGSDFPWTKWIIPTRYILPLLPDKKLAADALAATLERGGEISTTEMGTGEDGPFLAAYWWEGSGWGDERTKDFALQLFLIYLMVVPALIFLVVLIFGWNKGYNL